MLRVVRLQLCIGAGLCLALFLSACGRPTYRLEGRVSVAIDEVVLLDSLAFAAMDSVRHNHVQALTALEDLKAATLDSLGQSASNLGAPIAQAQRQYQDAQSAYRRAFLEVRRYRSFGGNPVLSEDDIGVGAQQLLDEIANRFYKGRAFSLETESALRNYIRKSLLPLEKKVAQARASVNRLKRSQSGRTRATQSAIAEFQMRRIALFEKTNQAILQALAQREFARTRVDSAGWYAFGGIEPRRLFVYAPHPLPLGFLIEVDLGRHTRQDLGQENARPLMLIDGKETVPSENGA